MNTCSPHVKYRLLVLAVCLVSKLAINIVEHALSSEMVCYSTIDFSWRQNDPSSKSVKRCACSEIILAPLCVARLRAQTTDGGPISLTGTASADAGRTTASIFECSVGNSKSQLHKTRKRLCEVLRGLALSPKKCGLVRRKDRNRTDGITNTSKGPETVVSQNECSLRS
jgi:hypothetical protein